MAFGLHGFYWATPIFFPRLSVSIDSFSPVFFFYISFPLLIFSIFPSLFSFFFLEKSFWPSFYLGIHKFSFIGGVFSSLISKIDDGH
jgi:hypothetical protein